MDAFGQKRRGRPAWLLIPMTLLALCAVADTGAQEVVVESIVISFEVPRLVKQDIFVQYDGNTVYLPVVEVLSLLDLDVRKDPAANTISGFIISQKNTYEIDLNTLRVRASGLDYHLLPSEFYRGEIDLYLRIDMFGRLFGLEMTFDFSLLRVLLPLNKDFPAYQRMERQAKRRKLQEKKIALRDVRTLPHTREYFTGGVADWTIGANPLQNNGQYYTLNMGGMLGGGDMNIGLAGNSREKFDPDQFTYRWHYYFDKSPYLTQASLGHTYTSGALGRQITGAMVTNKPQTWRRYFQTINVAGYAGENWEVELYVDNRLVDFTTTDSRGEYNFTLDVYYGASVIELQMYGPSGEIRTEQRYVRIPHNLIPRKELEYTLAFGESSVHGQKRTYAQTGAFYGILDCLTAGLSADMPVANEDDEKPLIAGEAVLQVVSNLTVTSSVSPNNAIAASFNYSKPSLVNANGSFTKYFENEFRNRLSQDYRWQLSLSCPLRLGGRYLGLRYYVARDGFPAFQSTNMNFGFTGSLRQVSLNYIGRYKVSRYGHRQMKSMISQFLVSPGFVRWFRPQFRFDYDHTEEQLVKYGLYINKRVFRTSQVTLSYERNELARSNSIMLTFNFLSSFAHFTTRALHAAGELSMSQIQRGSVRYNQDRHNFLFDRRNGVGYGSAVVQPFLDLNYNGRFDTHEPYLSGLRAKISGVTGRPRGRDRVYYYERLRPYDEYLVQIDRYSLDDPLLKPTNENYRVVLNPNMVTSIQVPLVMAGELSGEVKRQVEHGEVGIGGIKIIVINLTRDALTEITTFLDGEYYYLGLLPGSYRAYIDPAQLATYGYVSSPESIEFEVKPVEGGQSIENMDFLLVPKE